MNSVPLYHCVVRRNTGLCETRITLVCDESVSLCLLLRTRVGHLLPESAKYSGAVHHPKSWRAANVQKGNGCACVPVCVCLSRCRSLGCVVKRRPFISACAQGGCVLQGVHVCVNFCCAGLQICGRVGESAESRFRARNAYRSNWRGVASERGKVNSYCKLRKVKIKLL